MDQRLEQLKVWLNDSGITYQDIAPASADASFRRYFRITNTGSSYIVMDAPPEKEDCKPFIRIARLTFIETAPTEYTYDGKYQFQSVF